MDELGHGRDGTVVLFTSHFPYKRPGENSFILSEWPFLREAFARIIIVPKRVALDRVAIEGSDVHVDHGLASRGLLGLMARRLAGRCISGVAARELVACPELLGSPRALGRLLNHAGMSRQTKAWLPGFMKRWQIQESKTV